MSLLKILVHYILLSLSAIEITAITQADIIYSFDSYCLISPNGVISESGQYNCVYGNGAFFQNGYMVLQSSAYVSMNSAITQLFNTNRQFSVELFKVTTSTFQSPPGSELFIVMSNDQRNFINLFNDEYGYLSLGVMVRGSLTTQSTTSSFHSSGYRNYAIVADLNSQVVTLYLAGTQIAQITLPSNRDRFSNPIIIGTLNGYYSNPNYRLTYAAYDEVRLHNSALTATEVLENHLDYLYQTSLPSVQPTTLPSVRSPSRSPTKTPTLRPNSPSRTPSLSPTILTDAPQGTSPPSLPPTAFPTDPNDTKNVDQTSDSSHSTSSGTINAVISVTVLLCFGIGCVFYFKRQKDANKDGKKSTSCFSRVASYQPTFSSSLSSSSSSFSSSPTSTSLSLSLYHAALNRSKLFKTSVHPHHVIPQTGDCVICSTHSSSVVPLSCGHTLCIDDLQSYLLASLSDSSLFPLRCPMHCQGCDATIPTTMAEQFLSPENYQKYLDYYDRSIYGDGVRCIRCRAYIPLPDSRSNKIYLVACQQCTLVFCSQCKSLSHNGKRCPVDVDMEQFDHWVKKVGAMKCPACRRWIEKEDPSTCNHMCHKSTDPIPCVQDRTDFCYCCGEEVLASHPHDEVNNPGVNHFPQGVFQNCRTIIQQQREEEEEKSLLNFRSHPNQNRPARGSRSSALVVPYQ